MFVFCAGEAALAYAGSGSVEGVLLVEGYGGALVALHGGTRVR